MEDQISPMKREIIQCLWKMIRCKQHNSTSSHRMESPAQPSISQRKRSPSMEYRGDSPAPQSMNEDVAAANHNGFVAYHAPEYRGEPMSMFERQVLYRLDVL